MLSAALAPTPVRPKAQVDVVSYPLDEELVLYDAGRRQGFLLNPTAAQLWQLANGRRTAGTMARELARSYGIDYEQALADVNEFLGELRAAGLLAPPKKAPGGDAAD